MPGALSVTYEHILLSWQRLNMCAKFYHRYYILQYGIGSCARDLHSACTFDLVHSAFVVSSWAVGKKKLSVTSPISDRIERKLAECKGSV